MSQESMEMRLMKALLEGPTFRRVLQEMLDDMMGVVDADVLERFEGGVVRFIPSGSQKPHEVPVETFFKKVIAVREKLRVLEQKINNHPSLSKAEKVDLEQYITHAYGSLTSFNFLFKEKDEAFRGTGGE